MDFSPWDIVLIPFPFTDLSNNKVRPSVICAVVLNDLGTEDVIICAISSVEGSIGIQFPITHPEFKESGLKTSSRILTSKIVTLKKTLIKKRLGRIGTALQNDVRGNLKNHFNL